MILIFCISNLPFPILSELVRSYYISSKWPHTTDTQNKKKKKSSVKAKKLN